MFDFENEDDTGELKVRDRRARASRWWLRSKVQYRGILAEYVGLCLTKTLNVSVGVHCGPTTETLNLLV